MIVDDDAEIRQSLSELFEDRGHATIQAQNGQEAMDLLHQAGEPPCVILLDMLMPVMNGFEFLTKRESDARVQNIPVVAVSASPANLARDEVKHANHVLAKPLDLAKLNKVVDEYCRAS